MVACGKPLRLRVQDGGQALELLKTANEKFLQGEGGGEFHFDAGFELPHARADFEEPCAQRGNGSFGPFGVFEDVALERVNENICRGMQKNRN